MPSLIEPEMINCPHVLFFFQIDFIGYIPYIYIPETFFLFIQSRVLKGRLNFTRLNIIQTQNDASISRASCALSFIYEGFFSFFHPPFPFLIQQSIWKWCLAVGVYTHMHACMSLWVAFVCRASRLNGGWFRLSRLLCWLQWGCAETTFPLLLPILHLQGCSHNNFSRLKGRESVSSSLGEIIGPEMLQL